MKISDILFVIVLYNQSLEDSITYNSLLESLSTLNEGATIFLYDNSFYKQNPTSQKNNIELEYIHDPKNSGLSKSYNLAADYASKQGKTWLILLDQDTFLPRKCLNVYLKAISDNPYVKLFAPILKIENGMYMSPCLYKYKWGKLINNVSSGLADLNKYVPVNSGLCINLDAFKQTGGYNERVRVDGADFQFIERFKKKIGFKFYILDLVLHQDFSMFEKDFEKIATRYKIFLQDIKNFELHHWSDRFFHCRIILIRTITLLLQTRNYRVISIFFKTLFNA